MTSEVKAFVASLEKKPTSTLFNPWFERDLHHDESANAPEIRRRQLEHYLNERIHSARYLFIAEALGYQGGHFTGLAMTSERILLGHQHKKYGVRPAHVFKELEPVRTSHPDVNQKGMTEPTATIMWGSLIRQGIDPHRVVLWNAVPWHPYKPEAGLLSNRTPVASEMEAGLTHLKQLIGLFSRAKLVAVGRKCEESLLGLGKDFIAVRHPANGGAPKFRRQLEEMFS
ncbi:MAG: uracil-DNA glycosylase [Balneolaceae bacterium]